MTMAPGLRERIVDLIERETGAYILSEALCIRIADAILSITDPQAVRKAALEEAINCICDSSWFSEGRCGDALCDAIDRIRSLAASPAPTTDTKEA